jgi:hypothetical protein
MTLHAGPGHHAPMPWSYHFQSACFYHGTSLNSHRTDGMGTFLQLVAEAKHLTGPYAGIWSTLV